MKRCLSIIAILSCLSPLAFAQGVPNTFTAGQPALASEVNENFQTNADAIQDNSADIGTNTSNISGLDSRVTALEGATDPNSTTANVDCSTDSINDAINNAPAYGQLTVNITGSCTETVVITRSNTSLIGAAGASIAFDSIIVGNIYRDIESVIAVIGATRVVIDNLIISGSTSSAGLRLLNNASVLVSNSTFENNTFGVLASNNSSVQMSESIVQSNTDYGIIITDGAIAELRENNTVTHSANAQGAVGIFRNGSVRVRRGGNTISNTFTNGDAIEAWHGSQFRADQGTLTVNGNAEAGFLSQVEFRDATINGDLFVRAKGIMRTRATTSVTVNGDVNISGLGLYQNSGTPANTSIDGDIICLGYNSAAFGTADLTITGSSDLNGTCNL